MTYSKEILILNERYRDLALNFSDTSFFNYSTVLQNAVEALTSIFRMKMVFAECPSLT